MPSRRTEIRALIVSLFVIVAALVLFFAIKLPTAPQKLPTGQPPGTTAPARVEVPEEAKPVQQRESN